MSGSDAVAPLPDVDALAGRLVDVGRGFWRRGWVLATSGNFSAVVRRAPTALIITPSGADKGCLSPGAMLVVDGQGVVLRGRGRPSAEIGLHLGVISRRSAGAVLHTHSVWSALLAEKHGDADEVRLPRHEMLKGLAGVTTHLHDERVPIIANSQDYDDLARRLDACLASHPDAHGVLIRGHGLTTWGRDIDEARRHVEAFEFLFDSPAAPAPEENQNMAILTVPDEQRVLRNADEIRTLLADIGITYERWPPRPGLEAGAPADEILAGYADEIAILKKAGGYVTADVIDVTPETPGLEEMLARFQREHWHDEDEVRFIIEGRGLFHIRPRPGPVVAVETTAGDLLTVPRGTWHWFHLCGERRIRTIRLFQDPSGWSPHYTDSGVDASYEPVCLGPERGIGS